MAEIGNEFPIQNQAFAIPGLSEARRSNPLEQAAEEEPNNRVDEERQDNEARRTEGPEQGDRVNVAGRGQEIPGNAERDILRSEAGSNAEGAAADLNNDGPEVPGGAVDFIDQAGETELDTATGNLINVQPNGQIFEVPSQDVRDNLNIENPGEPESARSVADLNATSAELVAEPEGQGPVGRIDTQGGPPDPNLGEINEQIVRDAQREVASVENTGDDLASRQPVLEQEQSAQDRTVQQLVEEVVDDGRGPGLAAQAPDNPIFETPPQSDIVNDSAGTTGSTTGRSDPDNQSVQQAAREAARAQEEQEERLNTQQEPESVQTERGQNVNRLI